MMFKLWMYRANFPNGEVMHIAVFKEDFYSRLAIEDILKLHIQPHMTEERGRPVVQRLKASGVHVIMRKATEMLSQLPYSVRGSKVIE